MNGRVLTHNLNSEDIIVYCFAEIIFNINMDSI